jgi:hypothetical protein
MFTRAGYEALIAVVKKSSVFWDITQRTTERYIPEDINLHVDNSPALGSILSKEQVKI